MMSGESEELQGRIEDLKNENKMTEDALTKATMAHSLQVSNLNTEITIINSQYEKERASKEKVDAEVVILIMGTYSQWYFGYLILLLLSYLLIDCW